MIAYDLSPTTSVLSLKPSHVLGEEVQGDLAEGFVAFSGHL